jgi:hypothetical protein
VSAEQDRAASLRARFDSASSSLPPTPPPSADQAPPPLEPVYLRRPPAAHHRYGRHTYYLREDVAARIAAEQERLTRLSGVAVGKNHIIEMALLYAFANMDEIDAQIIARAERR